MQTILEIDALTKRYKNGRGVSDVSLTVNAGDIVGLLGPNGSGKTTIMKTIAGFIHPTSGGVRIFGHSIETETEKALSSAGFLIESPALYNFLTAEQNLKMAARYYQGVDSERIAKVLELVGLSMYRRDKVGRFSLGMKQRMGLALAMLSNPQLLILDEPLNGLDIEGVIRIRELISLLAERSGTAALISGHVAAELEKICNRVAVLHEGRVIACDTMENALKFRPTLEDYYISVVRSSEGRLSL